MREDEDMPRADGLRHDDPPFRENFSTQPDKTPEQLYAQRVVHRAVQRQPQPEPQPKPVKRKEPEAAVMLDLIDVVTLIRQTAGGGKYVNVDKLIEALK